MSEGPPRTDVAIFNDPDCLHCVIWNAIREKGETQEADDIVTALAQVFGQMVARAPPEMRLEVVKEFEKRANIFMLAYLSKGDTGMPAPGQKTH